MNSSSKKINKMLDIMSQISDESKKKAEDRFRKIKRKISKAKNFNEIVKIILSEIDVIETSLGYIPIQKMKDNDIKIKAKIADGIRSNKSYIRIEFSDSNTFEDVDLKSIENNFKQVINFIDKIKCE